MNQFSPPTTEAQNARRAAFYAQTRARLHEVIDDNGVGKIPQFNAPWREPVWILPALYTGPQPYIDLANKMVARYHDDFSPESGPKAGWGKNAKAFNIFQSNHFAHLLHRFGHLLTPAAKEVMTWQAQQTFKTTHGSTQPDFKYHGANDNMPTMATAGMIMAGEALGNQAAVQQGVWNLNQFRRLLSRSAWASEFNSSTYSACTLTASAQIASYARDPEIRKLARQIEHRIWAELLLHYHPGTLHQSGPQARAYAVDQSGHNHSVQALFWLVFGEEVTGRNVPESYFHPDGTEVVHFEGNYFQNIAEYCHFMDADFQVPAELADLIVKRKYPATLRGRSEVIGRADGWAGGMAAETQTCTYMEEDFSLGSLNGPWGDGGQCMSLYVTYKRTTPVKTWRDAATVFINYHMSDVKMGEMNRAADGKHAGERFIPSPGWFYTIQKNNVAAALATPNTKAASKPTTALKMKVIFPAHYGQITRSIIGHGAVRNGAAGESAEVVPVSVEAGEVFIHLQPLLPTNLPRQAAVRFVRENQYEILELVNYEGPERTFSPVELSRVLNGVVLTVKSKREFASLEAFHKQMSQALITDYYSHGHRFFLFQRADVEFDVVYTPYPFGAQTEGIDGRHVPRPLFESNQIDVEKLPFMTGPVARNQPAFPWDTLAIPPWKNPWIIGSRGLPGEENYERRKEDLNG
ncbi:MAG: hypothetical protein WCI73_10595 [Phycisphaerae bacterium]